MEQQFEIRGDYIELSKLLKATGLCSTGGQAKIVIHEKLVTVDDEIETRKGRKIREGMIVKYDAHVITVVGNKL